jgi:hypothetical protein
MNPINYATGLAVELTYALETGDKERETAVRDSLTWASAELDKLDPERLSDAVAGLLADAKDAAAVALATKTKRASAKTTE